MKVCPHPAAKRQITGALDASDPVTNRWCDVHAGCRLAVRMLDGLPALS